MPPLDSIAKAVQGVADAASNAIAQATKRSRDARERERRRVLEQARECGLDDLRWKSGRLHGRLFGVSVQWYQTSKSSNSQNARIDTSHCVCAFAPPTACRFSIRTPDFMDHIGRMLGGRRVVGPLVTPDNPITRFLMTEELHADFLELAEAGDVQLQSGVLKTQSPGTIVANTHVLGRTTQVAARLYARWLDRHREMETLGLVAAEQPGVWQGRVDGVQVSVQETRKRSRYSTTVRAALVRPLPAGTCLVRRRAKQPRPRGARPLGDRMLDPMLTAISSDMPAVSARVCVQSVHAPLLEILHGHPNSKLTSSDIILRLVGPIVGDCGTKLVAELHRALHP